MQSHTSELGSSLSHSSRTSQNRSSAAVARLTIRWTASSTHDSGSFNCVVFNGEMPGSWSPTNSASRRISWAAVEARDSVTRTGRNPQCWPRYRIRL